MNGDLNTSENKTGLTGKTEAVPQDGGAVRSESEGTWKKGDVIMERYEVLNELGKGGMGVVYRCLDRTDHTKVALKKLPRELTQNQQEMRDLRENFKNISRIAHKNIAVYRSLDKDPATDDVYLVTQCVYGESLVRWMERKRQEGSLTLETALPILRQIAEAVDFAHTKNLIHRDIKPGNVMVREDGTVAVLDFGLAAGIGTRLARLNLGYYTQVGSLQYKSPELLNGQAQGVETDVYSLAVVAYEMLAGHLPFDETEQDALREAVLKKMPEAIEGVPDYVNSAIAKGMAKTPEDRFKNCADFIRALSVEKTFGTGGSKLKAKSSSGRRFFNPKLAVALVIVIALGAALVAGISWLDKKLDITLHASEAIRSRLKPKAQEEQEVAETLENVKEEEETPEEQEKKRVAELHIKAVATSGVVQQMQQSLSVMEIDRGQTFGEKLDQFARKREDGDKLMGGKRTEADLLAAVQSYGEAEEVFNWIIKSIPQRELAREELKKADEMGKKLGSEKLNCSTEAFKNAMKTIESGRKAFDAGYFQEAQAMFKEANHSFTMIPVELKGGRRKELSDAILKEASIGSVENWQRVLALAKELEPLDEKTSGEWKAKAEKILLPHLSIRTFVGDEEVTAEIEGENGLQTPVADLMLRKGEPLELHFVYRKGINSYKGVYKGVADWMGRREITVPLSKAGTEWVVYLPNNTRLELIKVPAGTFFMGSPKNEQGRYADETLHRVTLTKPFWLGKFSVTQEQYKAVTKKEPSSHFRKGGRYPVENVTWSDAVAFCRMLTEMENAAGRLPAGYVFDLPTEAQWEYACRAGTRTALYTGDIKIFGLNNAPALDEIAWYGGNSSESYEGTGVDTSTWKEKQYPGGEAGPHMVGKKKPNKWGFYGMLGNVREWCKDCCDLDPKEFTLITDTYVDGIKDPCSTKGGQRVFRGGSWRSSARGCRAANRKSYAPNYSGGSLGFRVALVPVVIEKK